MTAATYVEHPRMDMFVRVVGEPRRWWLWPGSNVGRRLAEGVPLHWKTCRLCRRLGGKSELGFMLVRSHQQPRRSSIRLGPAVNAEVRLLAKCGHGTGWNRSMCAAMHSWQVAPLAVFNGVELADGRYWGPL